jgi:predicted nucleic acid-binding Zn ribbon protein
MTQKSLGYVELEWTCPNCKAKNPGTNKTCQACGSPQPTNVQFESSQSQELITDAEKLAAAKKGPDIHCPFCGTRNAADAAVCSQCGGDLKSGEKRVTGRVVGAYSSQPKPVGQIACPNCNTPNPDTRTTCSACGANLQVEKPEAAPEASGQAKPKRNFLIIGCAALAGIFLIAIIAYFVITAARRNNVDAIVQNVNWARIIAIQGLRDAQHSDWQTDIPAEATIGTCEKRQHHTQSEPPSDGDFEEVCGTAYTKETGSGFAEAVQDCQYVVYQDYCDYTIKEWQNVDEARLTGNDQQPAWPQFQLQEGQREGAHQETYTVVFATDQGLYTYTLSDPGQFSQFTPGSEWILVLNGFNQIVDIETR